MGDSTSSYATAGKALRVMWPGKPNHSTKVRMPVVRGNALLSIVNNSTEKCPWDIKSRTGQNIRSSDGAQCSQDLDIGPSSVSPKSFKCCANKLIITGCITNWAQNVFPYMRNYGRGFEICIGFIHHFNIQLVITLNYSAIADLHILQITRTHTH
jgi:hypothetical protein